MDLQKCALLRCIQMHIDFTERKIRLPRARDLLDEQSGWRRMDRIHSLEFQKRNALYARRNSTAEKEPIRSFRDYTLPTNFR